MNPLASDSWQPPASSGRIEHPNIARIHECGKDEEHLLWYSMELVENSLEQLISKNGPLDPAAALVIIERVANGLAAAQRIHLHWDIRPSAILIMAMAM